MDALTRQEYPAMLVSLQPSQAVTTLNERVKRVGRVNNEIADWLQERRKVEQLYVQGLKKLAGRQLPDNSSELGIFTTPWQKIVTSVDTIAESHKRLAERIEMDVEQPLRSFTAKNKEMLAMSSVQGNLASMAKELDDAQNQSDKLSKKGGKANAQKVDAASAKLDTASTQWETQAPFIFETLQALDETRLNHLRDVLTQLETHEADQVERSRITAEQTLNSLLEVETAQEIQNFVKNTTTGKPKLERRQPALRQGSTAGSSTLPPPTRSREDTASEHSGRVDGAGETKIKSRIGTMLGRRRQSIHGGFQRATSPNKMFPTFGRNTSSRDGRPSPSPRTSSNNLRESPGPHNRLPSLVETPGAFNPTNTEHNQEHANGTNSNGIDPHATENFPPRSSAIANGNHDVDVSDVQPPPGPPPSHFKNEGEKDAEGFTVPAAMNDPISQAQMEAADASDQPGFRLDIKNEPIREEDTDAQAAVTSVTQALRSTTLTPNRKAGTVRGRRDVRNTIYVPPSDLAVPHTDSNIPPSPGIAPARAQALAALSHSDHAAPSASDTTSIRSGHSLANNVSKHAESHNPGLSSSIIETVHASFVNGAVKDVKISGEIALTYNAIDEADTANDTETIRINNFPLLEAIGPNRIFVHPSTSNPDEFTVDLSHVAKSSIAFTYRRHIDEDISSKAAVLLLKPAWKPQADKLGFILSYGLNPASGLTSMKFSNLILVAKYEGPKASACKTKPSGVHLKDKSTVFWRLGDVTLTTTPQKLVAVFTVTEGPIPTPGHVEARWEAPGWTENTLSVSRLAPGKGKEKEKDESAEEEADPFADDSMAPSPMVSSTPGHWVELDTSTKVISGKYEALSV
ncbi:SAFF domain-containing protein [Phlyctema vagabunda]|uniref:SAFF domain-containing protein n=1 Tax=Phlyctema vagabunda TaxID=108571 RepID=A0ABR4PWH0_9HELO